MNVQKFRLQYFVVTPLFWFLVLLYLLVVLVRLEVGYWPSYGSPDNGLWDGFSELQKSVLLLLGLTLLSGPIGLVVLVADVWIKLDKIKVFGYWLVGTWLFLILYFFIDPGGYIDWFID